MTSAGNLSVERLPNGLYRVFDYRAKWTVLYEERDGGLVYRGGPVDHPDYREAVTVFLRQTSGVGQIATAVSHDHGSRGEGGRDPVRDAELPTPRIRDDARG